jgi:hypothetical protein
MNSSEQSLSRFCTFCGADLPPGHPRFCIECGQPVESSLPDEDAAPPAATGPTVQLANARTGQIVVGGTVKLPSSGAVPPGCGLRRNCLVLTILLQSMRHYAQLWEAGAV